jgi:hypothetical protein
MAGGWGGPIFQPMVIPQDPPSEMMPEQTALPTLKVVADASIPKPAKPAMKNEFTMSSGRRAEAEAFAAAMGNAFYITRQQNKRQKAKARARGRAAQRAAEKRKRR